MESRTAINLDVNASYGLDPLVAQFINEHAQKFLNPSSIHQGGQHAKYALEVARDQVRDFLNLPRDATVVFTSGAAESNNMALFMPFWSYLGTNRGHNAIIPELVTTTVEHPAVLETAKKLATLGVKVHYIAPRSDFKFYSEDFVSVINERTKLVSVMMVNNETGAILPVSEIASAVKKINPNILVHSDSVQVLGKKKIAFTEIGADLISISAHKVGGLSGIGALVTNKGIEIDPFIVGGPQETRRRAGTENVLGAISFGKALEIIKPQIEKRSELISYNRKKLKDLLIKLIPDVIIQFDEIGHIGNTISARFLGVNTSDLVVALDVKGVYVSSGSACSSGKTLTSSALTGYGLGFVAANETIRISVGHSYSEDQLENAANIICDCVTRLRKKSQ
jgi:cysteine desulfurase